MPEKTDHDMIIEMHAVLLGANGRPGLCTEFEQNKADQKKFREDYYKFKRAVLCVFFFLLGSGALGGIGVGIAELVKHVV
jgi:hypothetical protein